ncbi:hypothetical protein HX870_29575 [Pseudomonas gingeri]|uniref:hypothetical protein n=1 Tax=Pseudomonas gingeri TaxID=117681 RepID=UPI0015A3FFA8|nr:hypothetical protein [Pseudomonas gingeri]NWD71763.1 hypothetical protein [Pseudomonas gingeri]
MSESTAANSSSLTQSPAWKALQAHYQTLHTRHLRQLFDDDPGRSERFSVQACRCAVRGASRRTMANLFAQTEALAFGKTAADVKATGIPDWLVALSGRGNHHPHDGWTMGQGGR